MTAYIELRNTCESCRSLWYPIVGVPGSTGQEIQISFRCYLSAVQGLPRDHIRHNYTLLVPAPPPASLSQFSIMVHRQFPSLEYTGNMYYLRISTYGTQCLLNPDQRQRRHCRHSVLDWNTHRHTCGGVWSEKSMTSLEIMHGANIVHPMSVKEKPTIAFGMIFSANIYSFSSEYLIFAEQSLNICV